MRLPVFIYDAVITVASFPARLGALRPLMPDHRVSPARLAPGLGVVSVACVEYRDTEVGPFDEVAISVSLNEPWFRANLPGRALFESSEFRTNAIAMGTSLRPGATSLELGDRHQIARELAGLLVSRRPIQYVYTPRYEAIRLGPEHLTPRPIQRLAAPTGAGTQVTLLTC